MQIYTIGFRSKAAAEFFTMLEDAGVKRLVDVRLHNSSQLSGFTRRSDLPFFLGKIIGADYVHEPLLAPTEDLFRAFRKRNLAWDAYAKGFLHLIAERKIQDRIAPNLFSVPSVLLCSEPTADCCHRRLVAEYFQSKWPDVTIVHL